MANKEHLGILKQGVGVWNEWRKINPKIEPDLGEADLIKLDLIGANLSKARLYSTRLNMSRLNAADLHEAKLFNAILNGADLSDANLTKAVLNGAYLSNTNLTRAYMPNTDIRAAYKLIVVLSEDSMESEWVKTEIYHARQREVEEKRQILFPIRLVDFEKIRQWRKLDTDSGKDIAMEIREYFILDFSNWKNQDEFEKAFVRLLRDLKAESQT